MGVVLVDIVEVTLYFAFPFRPLEEENNEILLALIYVHPVEIGVKSEFGQSIISVACVTL